MKLIENHDPILRSRASEWDFAVDTDAEQIEKDMLALMTEQRGLGLAANQIGLLKRVFVIKLEDHEPFAMFNPSLLNAVREEELAEEGCLSFPGLFLTIKRPATIEVEYFDKTGKSCIMSLTGIDARCFLHELDHLNGICFTDNVSQLKLALARKKQRKYNGRTQR